MVRVADNEGPVNPGHTPITNEKSAMMRFYSKVASSLGDLMAHIKDNSKSKGYSVNPAGIQRPDKPNNWLSEWLKSHQKTAGVSSPELASLMAASRFHPGGIANNAAQAIGRTIGSFRKPLKEVGRLGHSSSFLGMAREEKKASDSCYIPPGSSPKESPQISGVQAPSAPVSDASNIWTLGSPKMASLVAAFFRKVAEGEIGSRVGSPVGQESRLGAQVLKPKANVLPQVGA